MKRIVLLALLSPLLAGCITLQGLETGISLTTKSIANPVTKSQEAQVELVLDSAIEALKAYKQACATGAADKNCKANVAQIQAYTRQINPLMVQLRNFVDANDQINATVIYNQLTALYTNVKGAAASLGMNLNLGNLS
jgi:predicted small secreted protein